MHNLSKNLHVRNVFRMSAFVYLVHRIIYQSMSLTHVYLENNVGFLKEKNEW